LRKAAFAVSNIHPNPPFTYLIRLFEKGPVSAIYQQPCAFVSEYRDWMDEWLF
jgi:hypothetical protein